jgi:hypothetical protein
MEKIILGIHGLGNKPPKDLLEKWWQQAIVEGLTRVGFAKRKFNFEIIYWADSLHPVPLNPDEKDEDNELFISEPYLPAPKTTNKKSEGLKKELINFFHKQRDKILFNETIHVRFPSFTDYIVKHFFKDLDIYFTKKSIEEDKTHLQAKEVIQSKFIDALKRHKGKQILIIAHSMGTIVAYDSLIKTEDIVDIGTLVTIGSPLAVPFIFEKLKNESSIVPDEKNKLRTPENILTEWNNLADTEDKLAQSADLGKLFKINSNNVKPLMELVHNDYESNEIENPHKSYGYLRTPEMAYIIEEFLQRGRNRFVIWISRKFEQLKTKINKH